MLYGNILETIGNTPLVKVDESGGSNIYAKLEYYNPGGSIKDRAALYMIRDALDKGMPLDSVIIEPTSGNTGIGLAMVAREYGLKLIIVMPSNMSPERIKIIKAYGAEIILTDAALGMKGAIAEAETLKATFTNARIMGQFDNPANPLAHYETTAPEIVNDLPTVKYVVSPLGSGGTAMGIKRYFKDKAINAQVCAVEPTASPVLSGGKAGRHGIQGIGAGFIPSIVEVKLLDRIMQVSDKEATEYARKLSSEKGILGGYSSGAAYAAAVKLSRQAFGDIVFIVPDTGMRYLSTDLYNV